MDYTHFKPSLLSSEEQMAIIHNGVAHFRESGKEEARYSLPTLFQAVGFFERLMHAHIMAERETPPRKLTDEEFYTEDFAEKLEFFTIEYELALAGCMELMDSVHSISPSAGLLASCYLNPLDSPHRAIPMNPDAARAQVCEHALMLSLTHSKLDWTQSMYDALMAWYPPALLLCSEGNIPPMAPPAVRIALEWAMDLDEKPKRRFQTMAHQFVNMTKPMPDAAAHLDLPGGFIPE